MTEHNCAFEPRKTMSEVKAKLFVVACHSLFNETMLLIQPLSLNVERLVCHRDFNLAGAYRKWI